MMGTKRKSGWRRLLWRVAITECGLMDLTE